LQDNKKGDRLVTRYYSVLLRFIPLKVS